MAIGLSAIAVPALERDAHADARSDARVHYLAGQKAYSAGDYKGAIREFSSAQSLAPADLNNYNLALCYDKLGDAEPAVQYYKAYLDKVPNTDKRAEIEASMQRLDAAVKSAQAKKAEEARKAEEAQKQIEAKRLEDARREEEAKRKAEEEAKRRADEEAARTKEEPAAPVGVAPVGVGSTGTPSTGQVRPTGDSQLDRVNQINIDQIRDQRVGGAGSGIPDRRQPPASRPRVGANDPNAGAYPATDPANSQTAQNRPAQPNAEPAAPADKPKATPVYKKWWFWAVVGVSAYVLYSIASEDSQSTNSARTLLPQPGSTGSSGVTLMRF